MTHTDTPKSAGEMMSDIMGNVGSLVRNEVDLARTEISTSLGQAAGAIGSMAIALVLAITGLNVLAGALVALVVWAGLSPPWAAAVVGLVLLIVAYLIFLSAKSAINRIGFLPSRVVRNVQRDASAIKEGLQ